MDIFPFLFNAMERFYEQLPQESKNALLESGQFSEILKQMYTEGYDAFVTETSTKLGLTKETIDSLLLGLAKKLNIDIDAPNQLFDKLQALVNKGLEDSAWDNLWHSVASQLTIIISGGRFNWASLAMGIVQFVYEKFIQKK